MYILASVTEHEMLAFAARLASAIDDGAIIYLHGDLGAGKTTFTRGFLRGLGYLGKVKSPTYTLVESYELPKHTVYHFDFYRVNNVAELEDLGIREYMSPPAICMIEWPEKGFPLLPRPDLICRIAFTDAGRDIEIIAHSEHGQNVLQKMEK